MITGIESEPKNEREPRVRSTKRCVPRLRSDDIHYNLYELYIYCMHASHESRDAL